MSSSHHSFASPAEALRALFAAWPADRGEGTGFAEAYIIAIQGYSLRAIDGAVKKIIRGEADDIDRRFLPSPAQLGNLVAHLEKLYAPPTYRLSLPAPGDADRTPEEQARANDFINNWRLANGRFSERGEIVTDRDAVPAAKLAALDKAATDAACRFSADLQAGRLMLSAEALGALSPMMTDRELEEWKNPKPKNRDAA